MKKLLILLVAVVAISISSFGFTVSHYLNNTQGTPLWASYTYYPNSFVHVSIYVQRLLSNGGEDDDVNVVVQSVNYTVFVGVSGRGQSQSYNNWVWFGTPPYALTASIYASEKGDFGAFTLQW